MRPPLDEPPVIVVGSGIAGALAARRLADAGVPVLVVEAGLDPPGAEGAAILADFTLGAEEDARWRWRAEGMPAAWVRVRRPGGRSRMWGGWFSPCPAASFEHDASAGSPWPFAPPSMLRLQHDVAEALRAWGVTVGTGASDGDGTIRARLSAKLGLPVLPRCAATVGERPLHALDLLAGVPLRTGLIATYLALHSGGAVEALVARAREGAEVVLPCREVVLAASPVETARILHETGRVAGIAMHPRIGRDLVDHLVVGRVVVAPRAMEDAGPRDALWVPRFVNTTIHPRSYPGGFSVEVSRAADFELLPEAIRAALPTTHVGDVDAPPSVWVIHALGETFPRDGREVLFDATQRDELDRAIPVVRTLLHDAEAAMVDDMEETCDVVATALAGPDALVVPTLSPRTTFVLGHEAGTCAMGPSPDHPVDLGGRVRGLRGVRVADGSLMPTATDRHPSAALLALTWAVTASLLDDLAGR